jgi:hypothetical protein
MYNFINTLLLYKSKKYKEMKKINNFDIVNIKEYLDSCIYFVYEKWNKNIISSLYEIEKIEIDDNKQNKNIYKDLYFDNIKVITSDLCGLGKSHKIKKMIKDKKKKYYYFPLGGTLTKKIIIEKLYILLEKIRKANEENYINVAIHLDLYETKINIINEFLFSFLITKFYADNEKIIYIPKDIEIYIEIPNCFENYLLKLSILNLFSRENITLDNMPRLDLPKNIIYFFNKCLDINSNEKIEEFLKKYIGIKQYSYHQVLIFSKIFLSQFNQFNQKLKFSKDEEDITLKIIENAAKSTKYFTL